jgi:hypothetical protein
MSLNGSYNKSLVFEKIKQFKIENPSKNITEHIDEIIQNVKLSESKKKKQKPLSKNKQIEKEELYRDFCDF